MSYTSRRPRKAPALPPAARSLAGRRFRRRIWTTEPPAPTALAHPWNVSTPTKPCSQYPYIAELTLGQIDAESSAALRLFGLTAPQTPSSTQPVLPHAAFRRGQPERFP